MKEKTCYNYILLLGLLLASCSKSDDDIWGYDQYEVIHYTSIWKNNRNIVKTYKYAYGVGADSVIRYKKSIWIGAIGFSWPTWYWPGTSVVINVKDSFAFPLKLDANRDGVTYCFVANDDSRDTVGISYTRKFRAYNTDAYVYAPENMRISYLSSRFLADSCVIMPSVNYGSQHTEFNQTNMRLMLKP